MHLLAPFRAPRKAAVPDTGDGRNQIVALTRPQSRASWEQITPTLGNPWTRVPSTQNLLLFEQLAQTIPILNAALARYVALVGCPYVESDDDETVAEINDWMERVTVNRVQQGFGCWVGTYMRDYLLYGRAHAELILPATRDDIWGIQELHTRTVDFQPAADGYNLNVIQMQTGASPWVVLNKALVLTSVFDVQNDQPHGNSLFHGLPFVAEIVTSMLKDQRRSWERFGTPAYHIRYVPPPETNDPTGSKSQGYLSQIMAGWNAMLTSRAQGDIQDFSSAGDIEVRVIGAAGETLEFTTPFRTILEQVVAKTGLPPMMLGLQWQAGERIGAVQAGLISETVEKIRYSIAPQMNYAIRLRQLLAGRRAEFKLCWNAPTLMDQLETARAELMEAQADAQEFTNAMDMWRAGMHTRFDAVRAVREDLEDATDDEILAALPDLPEEPPAAPAPATGFGNQQPPGGPMVQDEQQQQGSNSLTYPPVRKAMARNGRH